MRSSAARGGPLDSVKIHAGYRWDGRVASDSGGRYVWEKNSWTWKRERTAKKRAEPPARRRRS